MSAQLLAQTCTVQLAAELAADPATGDLRVQTRRGPLVLEQPGVGLRAALQALVRGGHPAPALERLVQEQGGAAEAAQFATLLGAFGAMQLLRYTIPTPDGPLATRAPCAAPLHARASVQAGADAWALSRFACCRRDGDALILESPLAYDQIILHDGRGAALLARLATPQPRAEFAAHAPPGVGPDAAALFFELLLQANLLTRAHADGVTDEDATPALAQWEFHDLLFHSASRRGRHAAPYGGTYPFRDKFAPLPAVKPPMEGAIVELERPDLQEIMSSDPPFTQVIERRASLRDHGSQPISVVQLSEFLYRTARVRELSAAGPMETSRRPAPSGGGCHPLEIYPVVGACRGLEAGIYHYDPYAHRLCRLAGVTDQSAALLREAQRAVARPALTPQILLVISARFQRTSWKYRSLAYALLLKDVGALFQTMYLVATAMGLAPCALGGGDAELFAAAAGLDPLAETSVGEFLLGSRPTSEGGAT